MLSWYLFDLMNVEIVVCWFALKRWNVLLCVYQTWSRGGICEREPSRCWFLMKLMKCWTKVGWLGGAPILILIIASCSNIVWVENCSTGSTWNSRYLSSGTALAWFLLLLVPLCQIHWCTHVNICDSEWVVCKTFVAVFLSYIMFLLLIHFFNLDLKYICAPVRTFMAVFLT